MQLGMISFEFTSTVCDILRSGLPDLMDLMNTLHLTFSYDGLQEYQRSSPEQLFDLF